MRGIEHRIPEPMLAPHTDGIGGITAEVIQTSNAEQLINDKYEILVNFKVPDNYYGHPYVSGFTNEIINHLDDHEYALLQIIGEPASGKTFAASQWTSLFHNLGIHTVYIPFVDVIRDAKEKGLVAKDSPFGKLTLNEYDEVTKLYYELHESVIENTSSKKRVIIGESPGIPTLEPSSTSPGELVVVNRGAFGVKKLVQEHDAFVAALYASSGLRNRGKDFRFHLPDLTESSLLEVLEKYNIEAQEGIASEVTETLKKSGAPFTAVEHYERIINQTLLYLASEPYNKISLPANQRSLEFLEAHPRRRARIIGEQFFPYLLGDILSVSEDHAFEGYNRISKQRVRRYDLDRIHYHTVIIP